MHGDHNRYLYTRTEADQARWLEALRAASRTEPFEEKYTLGVTTIPPLPSAPYVYVRG